MNLPRAAAAIAAPFVVLTLAACGSSTESADPETPGASTTDSSATGVNDRGAVEAALGEPVERPDGAYALTLDSLQQRGEHECDTYGDDRTPAGDGGRLITAHMTLRTGASIPEGLMPTYVPNFYAVNADGLVKAGIEVGGEYQCENDGEGRGLANQNPMPNATIERIETFLIPDGSVALGYRDKLDDGSPFGLEWSLDSTTPPTAGATPTAETAYVPMPDEPAAEVEPLAPTLPPNPYPNSRTSDGSPTGQGGGTLTNCAGADYQTGTGVYARPDGSTYMDYAAECTGG